MLPGIIYVSDSELGWQPVGESWLQKRKESEATALRPCFTKLVSAMLDFVRCGAVGARMRSRPQYHRCCGYSPAAFLSARRLKLHPVMGNQDVCQIGTLLTLLDGSLAALTGEVISRCSDAVCVIGALRCALVSVDGAVNVLARPTFGADATDPTTLL